MIVFLWYLSIQFFVTCGDTPFILVLYISNYIWNLYCVCVCAFWSVFWDYKKLAEGQTRQQWPEPPPLLLLPALAYVCSSIDHDESHIRLHSYGVLSVFSPYYLILTCSGLRHAGVDGGSKIPWLYANNFLNLIFGFTYYSIHCSILQFLFTLIQFFIIFSYFIIRKLQYISYTQDN